MDVKVDAVFSLIKQGVDDMSKYEDELQEGAGAIPSCRTALNSAWKISDSQCLNPLFSV